MTRRSILAPFAALALAAGASGAQAAACQFQKIADVPVTMNGLRPTITTQIDGRDAKFLIDTGAFFGAVTPEAVTQYGMKGTVIPPGMMVQGVGGHARNIQAVQADQFTFAGMGFRNTQFMVIGRVGGDGVAGNIGENLMGPFDVEYDLGHGMIRYFRAIGCGHDSDLAYWSQGMTLSKLDIIDPTNILSHVITNAKVDGRLIKVTFDTGSSLSVLSRNAAARAGIQVTSQGVVSGGVTYGIYGKGTESFLAPFESFQIGDEIIKNTRLRVADIDLPASDMLLGADFFLSHRILISNSQKRVYFTYNGGPVFRLESSGQQQAQAAPAGPGAAAPGAGDDEPKTGEAFARRAAALAARREFQPAIADYTRAIALEPDNAAHYRARAMLRLLTRQPVLAMSDLDEALKRQPNDPEALMRRGELYLAAKDMTRAKVDFDAATRLAPADSSLAAQIGVAYARAGQFEPAIQQLDGWIAAHARSEDLPQALSARCYARAAWGRELETALADCDAALRGDKISSMMQNRGLVLLRMGRLDEAIGQYGEAVRAQPRAAPALYGRGLAELKKGDKAAGDADIAAAQAIAPAVGEPFKRIGLEPAGGS
jgi:tetratricopeptide (TPR) repeat protein/predicted aspartyl protease